MSNINVLRQSIEPIANMLAGKDVKVSFDRGVKFPQTIFDSKRITIKLPMLSDKTPASTLDALQGSVDHEVAHAIWSCDQVHLKPKDKLAMVMYNTVEDVRIEREMRKLFRGSAYNLDKMARAVVNEGFIDHLRDCAVNKPALFKSMGTLFYLQASEGVALYQETVEKVPELTDLVEKLKEGFGDHPMNDIQSVKDSYKLGDKIRKFLDIRVEQQNSDGSDDGKSESEDEKSKGKKGKKSKGEAKHDKKPEGEEQETFGMDGDGDSDGEGKKDGSDAKDGESKDGDAGDAEGNPAVGSGAPSGDALSPEDLDELSDMTKNVIKELVAKAQEHDEYVVKTTDYDCITHIAPSAHIEKVQKLNEMAKQMAGAIQKNLERAIAARSISVWTPNHRSGKLFAPSLVKIFSGETKVFRRKEQAMSKDVAVSLVVDCSGSMSGDKKASTAASAAYALCEVLTRMGIKNEVIGFTTKQIVDVKCSREEYATYSRVEPIYMPVFKSFSDKFDSKARLRMVKMFETHWMRNNIDGESLNYAAQRLLAQGTKGKIMIVLSDGYPSAYGSDADLDKHLKETVAQLSKYINIVGIGIRSKEVKHYYPKYVVLNEVEELPSTVVRELQRLLLSSEK